MIDNIRELGARYYSALIESQRYFSYLDGLFATFVISIFAIIVGVAIGAIIAVVKYFSSQSPRLRLLEIACDFYVLLIRGTPVMLQILIIANFVFVSRNSSPIVTAIVAFGINSGAYVAEIIRAGINSIDRGQMEAGRSLGMNQMQTMRLIILPQAIRNILPALGNEFIVLIKETSIAGVIAVTDLTKAAQYIGTRTFDMLPPLFIAAVIYLAIVLCLTRLMRLAEKKLAAGDHH